MFEQLSFRHVRDWCLTGSLLIGFVLGIAVLLSSSSCAQEASRPDSPLLTFRKKPAGLADSGFNATGKSFAKWINNERFIFANGEEIICFDSPKQQQTWRRKLESPLTHVDVIENKVVLTPGSENKVVDFLGQGGLYPRINRFEILNAATGKTLASVSPEDIADWTQGETFIDQMLFSAKYVIVVCENRGFVVDLGTLKLVREIKLTNSPSLDIPSALFDGRAIHENKYFSYRAGGSLSVVNFETGEVTVLAPDKFEQETEGHEPFPPIGKFSFSPSHGKLISIPAQGVAGSGAFEIFDFNSGKKVAVHQPGKICATDIQWSSKRLATVTSNGDLTLYDFSGQAVAVLEPDEVIGCKNMMRCRVSVSPDGKSVLAGSNASNLSVFSIR